MMPTSLSQNIGPLPAGAWLGLAGGAIGISRLSRRKRLATSPAPAPIPATTAQDQSSRGAVQDWSGGGSGSGSTSYGTSKPSTNEEWANQAVSWLIAGGAQGSRATNAISHVLYPDSASPTSPEDSALYNLAVAKVGAPPNLPSQAYIPDAPMASPPTKIPAPVVVPPHADPPPVRSSGGGYVAPPAKPAYIAVAAGNQTYAVNTTEAARIANTPGATQTIWNGQVANFYNGIFAGYR